MVRQIVVCLAVIVIGSVLGANVYNSVVDVRSWCANMPESLNTAQRYFTVVTPATFFRVASPVAQVLALVALIVCWRVPGARVYAATALVASIVGDLMTFGYFYPRNAIIMGDLRNVDAAMQACREWARMNHVRNALVLGALVAELMVLTRPARHKDVR
jgi:hypothetical protein